MYSLPAGHIETGESPKQAMTREAKEEINVSICLEDLQCILSQYNGSNGVDYANYFFTTKTWKGEVKNLEPEKCSELYWCDRDNLPDNMTPEVISMFTSVSQGEIYDEVDIDP